MLIGLKDTAKLVGIMIVTCCAVFVCALFLNFNIDIRALKGEIVTADAIAMYNAVVTMGHAVAGITGGCLVATTVVMLMFYIKNYIDTHGKELGILKALGHSRLSIAKHFWVFGLSVFIGCAIGYLIAFLYLPTFYEIQNADGLFPSLEAHFNVGLASALVLVPTVIFSSIAILYAYFKMRKPTIELLKEKHDKKVKISKKEPKKVKDVPFLRELAFSTLKSKKSLIFFVLFSAFCFSAMVQMSFSMKQIASEAFFVMILTIGLVLAFVTLIMSLSSVAKGNAKTIAMMSVMGYKRSTSSLVILGVYRPLTYIGFIIGTVYQYVLLKLMLGLFNDIEMPEYKFDFKALAITLAVFIVAYELVMYLYTLKIKRVPVKSVMID